MSEIHGAVGSYVVNALDPDELDEFEAHLAVCPTCSREVQEFGETAAELSLLASVIAAAGAARIDSGCHFRGQAAAAGASEPRLHPLSQRLLRLLRSSHGRSMSWRCVGSSGVPASSACWLPQSWRLRWRWVAWSMGWSRRDRRRWLSRRRKPSC